ncbi:MAG: potassium channel family protein [Planctomycetota bacterium]
MQRSAIWNLNSLWLFLCLSSVFLVYPLVSHHTIGRFLLDVLFSGTILLAIFATSSLPRSVHLAYVCLGIAGVVVPWLPLPRSFIATATPIIYSIFFAGSVIIYGRRLFADDDVDIDKLLGATCTYMLIGMFFATLYMTILQFDPDAIRVPDSNEEEAICNMTYFSFVTLTTLGYGDVLPVSLGAKMLAAYEAVIGQIFVTVVVAVLVGNYVSRKERQRHIENSRSS